MRETNQNSDPFDNISREGEEEYTYPWNNDQLNFNIISDIMTNKEQKRNFEILFSEENVTYEEKENNFHDESVNLTNVIYLIKKDVNYENENLKKKKRQIIFLLVYLFYKGV